MLRSNPPSFLLRLVLCFPSHFYETFSVRLRLCQNARGCGRCELSPMHRSMRFRHCRMLQWKLRLVSDSCTWFIPLACLMGTDIVRLQRGDICSTVMQSSLPICSRSADVSSFDRANDRFFEDVPAHGCESKIERSRAASLFLVLWRLSSHPSLSNGASAGRFVLLHVQLAVFMI
jgi:hypothetical protein